MGRSSLVWAAPLVILWAGCGGDGFTASEEPAADAGTDVSDGAVDANQDVDAGRVETGGPDAPEDVDAPDAEQDVDVPDGPEDSGPICSTVTGTDAVIDGDGIIVSGNNNCNGANSFLHLQFANVGIGRGLLRFQLDQATLAAFEEGRVQSMSLELKRVAVCDGSDCPKKSGPLEAYPLRNEWDEGSSQPYTGADWCRRAAGTPGPQWDAPGADNDHGALAAEIQITDADTSITFDLNPAAFGAQWIKDGKLSILLIPRNGATFVFGTREGTPELAPQLTIVYCE